MSSTVFETTKLIRKARLSDVRGMQVLVNSFANRGHMLPLSLSVLYDDIRDFSVACDDGDSGAGLLGCCALRVFWEDLAEIRSVAVAEEAHGRGLGRGLVLACLDEARELGVSRVFALTEIPEFFIKLGFRPSERADLPHKVWYDCVRCPKFPDCDEVPVVIDF